MMVIKVEIQQGADFFAESFISGPLVLLVKPVGLEKVVGEPGASELIVGPVSVGELPEEIAEIVGGVMVARNISGEFGAGPDRGIVFQKSPDVGLRGVGYGAVQAPEPPDP
ncbi:hypothetical protein SDC9_184381 [bioreactor metagenome]|uniref:Uncharacterized protein n=1 Tax=bioreactor metagenome TaxID=1076179 RepID=A0A645HFC7_9ZZZZ